VWTLVFKWCYRWSLGSFWAQILNWWTHTEKLVYNYLYLVCTCILYPFLFSMCYSDKYNRRNIVKYHYYTVRKVTGSILDSVIEIFYLVNPSGVDSASKRNEYQEYFLGGIGCRCVGLTTLPSSCAYCLKI